jgi:transposase-like protein
MSALQFARQVGLPYETAYMMFQKLRAGMVNPERTLLVGPVEIDEAYIGGTRKGKPGRGALNKAIVAAAVEVRGQGKRSVAGRVRLRVVPDASGNQLNRFIQDHVTKGSAFKTDEWKSYTLSEEYGYPHTAVPSDKGRGLPHVHRVFSNLKTWLRCTHHGVSKKHLQAYLNEYAFRFNRRKAPMAAFQTVLGIGSHVPGPTYRGIYEGKWSHHNP